MIPKVTKHLLSNPVFTCITLAACMEIGVVAGFAAFLGKYLEQQFNLTTTSANQLLGAFGDGHSCITRPLRPHTWSACMNGENRDVIRVLSAPHRPFVNEELWVSRHLVRSAPLMSGETQES